MKRFFILGAFAGLLASQPSYADRNITRECRGALIVVAGDQTASQVSVNFETVTLRIDDFRSRGNCRRINPNRCRTNAREAAQTCAASAWRSRFTPDLPPACAPGDVLEYETVDLDDVAREAVCNAFAGRARFQVASVFVVTGGDTGCGGGDILDRGSVGSVSSALTNSQLTNLINLNDAQAVDGMRASGTAGASDALAAPDSSSPEVPTFGLLKLGIIDASCGLAPLDTSTWPPTRHPDRRSDDDLQQAAEDFLDNRLSEEAQRERFFDDGDAQIPGGNPDTICSDFVSTAVARDPFNETEWNPDEIERLCAGSRDSREPGLCYRAAISREIGFAFEGGWGPDKAIQLCAGTPDAQVTLTCYVGQAGAGATQADALRTCGG